jgi:hypothetical protein
MKKIYFFGSILLFFLIAVTAFYGLFVPGAYSRETANWATQARAQDWVDLLLAAPILLASAFLAYKKSSKAYLVWLGTLFFIAYSFLLYAFLVHFNAMFPVYMAVLGLSIYFLIFSLAQERNLAEKIYHMENWSRKGSAILLLVSGIIFYLVWGKEIFSNLLAGTIPRNIIETGLPTNGVYVIDTAFCLPALIIGGYRLLKKRKLGYVLGGGFLVFSTLMAANITLLIGYSSAKGFATEMPVIIVFGLFTLINLIFAINYIAHIRNG